MAAEACASSARADRLGTTARIAPGLRERRVGMAHFARSEARTGVRARITDSRISVPERGLRPALVI